MTTEGVVTIRAASVEEVESVRFGGRAWVEDLAVHPARRSLGIGKCLLDAAKDWARARGASRLELESAEGSRGRSSVL
jgi:GNAT superfamily N-acetyltransferase